MSEASDIPTEAEKPREMLTSKPMLALAGMYENTSAKSGKRYFVGYLDKARVLLMQNPEAKPNDHGWTLYIAERPERTKESGK